MRRADRDDWRDDRFSPRERKAVRFRRIIIRSRNVIADLPRLLLPVNKPPEKAKSGLREPSFLARLASCDIG